MADPYAPPDVNTVNAESPGSSKKKDSDLPAYRYAKALCEAARSSATQRVSSFKSNWQFLLGRNHWDAPKTMAAKSIDEWAFKGVVNWTYATIKTKTAMLTSALTECFIEPLDDESSYYDRLLVKSAVEHEMTRVRFQQVKEDVFLNGSVTGVGIAMWGARPDPLTGAMALTLVPVKPDEFYRDPSADSISSPNCRYVVWEPELDMSTVRQMWPSKASQVKANMRQVTGGWTYKPDGTDDNLIYGTSGEFIVDKSSTLNARKARVSFVWVRDESVIEDLQTVVLTGERPGFSCAACNEAFEAEDVDASQPCPVCGAALENVMLQQKTQTNKIVRRAYPYGRLLVYSGDTLLYDGENPYEIEGVFPFAVYHHDRIPGDFYGQNDVDALSSLQKAQNTVVSMGVDGVVLAMFGPFEYPVGAKAYTSMGNGPKQGYPVPDHLAGKARFITSSGADTNLWNGVLNALERQFQIVTGLVSPMTSPGSAPISATEAEITNSRLSDRMKGHADNLSQFCSDCYSIGWQLMQQFYENPIVTPVPMPDSEVKSISIEVSKLPNVRVRVQVNTEMTIRDKQMGQNVTMLATPGPMGQAPLDGPYADVLLEGAGFSPSRIKEFMERRSLQAELSPPPMAPMDDPALSLVPEGGMNG